MSSICVKGRKALDRLRSTFDLMKLDTGYAEDKPMRETPLTETHIKEITTKETPVTGAPVEEIHVKNAPLVDARNETCDNLNEILMSVLDQESLYLGNEAARSFYIILNDLQLEETNDLADPDNFCFFSPMPLARLESFTFDKSDEDTERFLHRFGRWEGLSRPQSGEPLMRNARALIGKLRWLVGACKRIFPDEDRKSYLLKAVNWRYIFFCPEILDEDLYDMLDSASRRRAIIPDGIGTFVKMFDITDGYIAWPPDIRADQPHVIIMIDHKYPGDDMISRAEILAIIAVIMTQLQHENLAEHCIIPVMVVSFMDSLQGRILQAHMTNSGLIIKKSKLHDFDRQADFEKSMTLFSRYMACDRIGNTRKFVKFDMNARDMSIRAATTAARKSKDVTSGAENTMDSLEHDIGKWSTELEEKLLSVGDSSKRG
ncbi:hypothetical protein DTO271D3_6781 [Paecilomyces variotii]|nr:hypothetical protein DTO169E5_8334 [Paecilomyces variotii]KAJ9313021.1 hypothetical protein DTO271D3_6781 [Paecilomyces variotii]